MDEFKNRLNEYFTWSIKMKEIEGENSEMKTTKEPIKFVFFN